MLKEIETYINTEGAEPEVAGYLQEMKSNITYDFPVCVLSHMYDKKRSKFLANLIDQERDRQYIIYTYADQRELYKQFEELNNVHVHYIAMDNPYYLSLTGKRQYIMEDLQSKNIDNGFFIEDDCFNFYLPLAQKSKAGNHKNGKFSMTYSLTFAFWEFMVKKFKMSYSGPVDNTSFTFTNLAEVPFVKQHVQVVQAIHMNVKECKDLNINFDDKSGWDDYDMIIQQVTKNKSTHGMIFSYMTPALKSGVSTMSASADALSKRCEKNTNLLIDKWGLGLVRIDTKKGLFNAKINWFNVRVAIKAGIHPSELIGMTNDEAKTRIKSICSAELEEW